MVAEVAIRSAVATLGDLLIKKVHFLQGVEGEVGRLRNELTRMQCFLKDAAEKQANDERVRNWISEMREVAQDAEDAIEIFVLRVESARSRAALVRWASFPKRLYYIHSVGKEIENIQNRLNDIERSRVLYGIENLGEAAGSSRRWEEVESRRRLAHWQKEKHVVGLEKDVELLLGKVILEESGGLSAATVVGMGGIGKSTLAKKIYKHAAVAGRFEFRGWVVVSSEFRPKEIIKELISKLVKPTENKMKVLQYTKELELQDLQEMLHERLQGTRYFIVIDDIWEDSHWQALATAFPDEDNCSRLLLTSRNRVITNYTRCVHQMKFLNHYESWTLFLNKAFIDNRDGLCPKDLESVGREIVKKCKGLPLAISVVGGLVMKHTHSGSELDKVLKGLNSHVGSSENNVVSEILELSYQNLSPQLKSCFLCLALFKEDAVISAKKLVHIWIAQGFVPQVGEKTMEEIASGYLDELVNRNLVQVKDLTKLENGVKSCHVHDLLHELSITKAKEEINYESVVGEGSSCKPRHRVVYSSRLAEVLLGSSSRHLRSLLIRNERITYIGPSHLWKSFELLRVLDFDGCVLSELPSAIGNLIGLRYLGLRNARLGDLPSSLSRLKNLQVLDIRECFIDNSSLIWKMDSLRHLRVEWIRCKSPLNIDAVKNYQTLFYIYLRDSDIEHVRKMTSLCRLGILMYDLSDVSKLFTSLSTLENLYSLSLSNGRFSNMEGFGILHRITQLKLKGLIAELPSNFPPNLSSLTLYGACLNEDPMPILQKLPKLLYLNMHEAYGGEEMVISNEDGFPRLKVLILYCMPRLRNLGIKKGAMPELKRLEIDQCPNLSLPEEVRVMSNLEELKIVTTTEMALKLGGVDSYLISNIPSLHLVTDPYLDSWKNTI